MASTRHTIIQFPNNINVPTNFIIRLGKFYHARTPANKKINNMYSFYPLGWGPLPAAADRTMVGSAVGRVYQRTALSQSPDMFHHRQTHRF
jgi:hypothetical protein